MAKRAFRIVHGEQEEEDGEGWWAEFGKACQEIQQLQLSLNSKQ